MITKYIKKHLTVGSDAEALAMLSGLAICTILPTSLLGRKSYAFSVGYGASVATMAFAILLSFGMHKFWTPDMLICYGTITYGVRLAAFLLWRRATVKAMAEQTRAFDEKRALSLIPLIACLGILYSCMTSPVLFLLRDQNDHSTNPVSWVGAIISFMGLLVEGITDQQKLSTKWRCKSSYDDMHFVGPTSGLYSMCRHPNYLGEVLFWFGNWLAGIPSYGTRFFPWTVSTLGLCSIYWIMNGSAARLDKKQLQKYRGQHQFEEWKRNVPGSIFPHVSSFGKAS